MTLLEVVRLVTLSRFGAIGIERLERWLASFAPLIIAFDESQADAAFEAFKAYGKGIHSKAKLVCRGNTAMNTHDIIDSFARHGPLTEPGRLVSAIEELPDDLETVRAVIAELIVHTGWAPRYDLPATVILDRAALPVLQQEDDVVSPSASTDSRTEK